MIVADRVAKGVAWLDENKPGWERRVILNDFDIRNSCKCVLGQVFEAESTSEFNTGFVYAVLNNHELDDDYGFDYAGADAPGLDAPDKDWEKYSQKVEKDYEALQREWIKVIKKRQKNLVH